MIKKLLLAVVFAAATVNAAEVEHAAFNIDYDLDATAITYCNVTGERGSPFARPVAVPIRITTSGSSTTTTELVASSAPFESVAAGDILIVDPGTGPANVLRRVITAKASSASLTVNTAWDLSATAGYNFYYLKTSCGTAATSGWISVAGATQFTINFQIDQVNVTGGVDMQVQCRGASVGSAPIQIFPSCTTGSCNTVQNYSGTAGLASRTTIVTTASYSDCRVGILIHTSDDGGDTGANAEQITIGLAVQK